MKKESGTYLPDAVLSLMDATSSFWPIRLLAPKVDIQTCLLDVRTEHLQVHWDIAIPLNNVISEEVIQLPHLRELPLAYPVTSDESFKISLLIGVDHYWDIVEDNIIEEIVTQQWPLNWGTFFLVHFQYLCIHHTIRQPIPFMYKLLMKLHVI